MRSLNPQLLRDPLCQAPEDIEQLLLVEGDLSTKRWGQSLSGPTGGYWWVATVLSVAVRSSTWAV